MTSYIAFSKNVSVGMSSVFSTQKQEPGLGRKLKVIANMGYYFFRSGKCKHDFELFSANPDLESASRTWNMLDDKLCDPVVWSVSKSVGTNKVLHVKKLLPPITLESINQLPNMDNEQIEEPLDPSNLFKLG